METKIERNFYNKTIEIQNKWGLIQVSASMERFYNPEIYNKGVDLESLPEHLQLYNPQLDYVGPESNPTLAKLVPDSISGVKISIAGFHHDRKYALGGDEMDRYYADREFLIIIESCILTSRLGYMRRKWALWKALKFFNAVHIDGYKHFQYKPYSLREGRYQD